MAFKLNPYTGVNTFSDSAPLKNFERGFGVELPTSQNPYSPEKADLPSNVPQQSSSFPTQLGVEYGTVDDVLPGHMQYVADHLGLGGKKQNGIVNYMQRALNNGETIDDIRRNDDMAMTMSFADSMAAKTAKMDSTQFEELKAQMTAELGYRPQLPQMPEVENPSLTSSLFALAASLVTPSKYQADVLAVPFNYQLAKRDQQYKQAQQQFEMDWDAHQGRLKNLDNLMQFQQQRDVLLANLENDALNRGMSEKSNLLSIARSIEADTDKLTSAKASAHFQRLRDIYKAAGHPEMAPTQATEDAVVESLRDQEALLAQAKTLEGRRKLIPSLVNAINRDGVSAARGISGMLLKGIMATDPDGLLAYGVDPIALDQKLKELEQPTAKERFNAQRVETEKARAQKYQSEIGLNQVKAENLAKSTWWMDYEKSAKIGVAQAQIDNVYSLIQDRGQKNAIAIMKANKSAYAQSQTSINVGLGTLSAQINEISRQIGRKQEELNKIGPGTDEVTRELRAPIEDEMRTLVASMTGLRSTYNELQGQAKTIRDAMQKAGIPQEGVGTYQPGGKRLDNPGVQSKRGQIDSLHSSYEKTFGEKAQQFGPGSFDGSLHKDGLALDLRGKNLQAKADWATKQPGVQLVVFNGRQWRPGSGWTAYPKTFKDGKPTNPHIDHVHVDMGKPSASAKGAGKGGLTPAQQALKDKYLK